MAVSSISPRKAQWRCRYRRGAGVKPTLFVVEHTPDNIFGGFCASEWANQHSSNFFGRGECFLFGLKPADDSMKIEVFRWTRADDHFQYATSDGFGMGRAADGSGFGLWIASDLSRGTSLPSSTFGSPRLADPAEEFTIKRAELWGFDCAERLARNTL